MPRYRRSHRGEFQKPKNRSFKDSKQLIHFLATATDEEWQPFGDTANHFLTGKKKPSRRLKRTHLHTLATHKPFDLLQQVHDEFNSHHDPDRESLLGGGIVETIHTVGHEVAHLLGLDRLSDLLTGGPKENPRTRRSEVIAYLTDETYKKPSERRNETVGYTRVQKYDSEQFAVWEQASGEILVTVRGSKLNWDDISTDIGIMFGKTGQKSDPLDALLDQIEKDYPGKKYDIAGHSLATSYILTEFPEHRDNMDDVFLFNPASSPTQSTEILREQANRDAFYFINQGDIVSNGMYQQMERETLDNNVFTGPYIYAPWSAHSVTQWYSPDVNFSDSTTSGIGPQQPNYEAQESSFETAEFGQDTEQSREAGLS